MTTRRALLTFLAVAFAFGPLARAEPPPVVSLVEFNPPAARRELAARTKFWPVYTAVEEHDGFPTELMGLRVLLGDPGIELASKRLRRSVAAGAAGEVAALRAAEDSLARWLRQEAARSEFGQTYLSYAGPGGHTDPDFLIYTTPHATIARLYGEVVFEVREETPRGVDLNRLNRDVFGFYDALPLSRRLNPRAALIRNVLDRDEYVIPSHIPSTDVVAVEVRARLPALLRSASVRLSGRVQRRYVRVEEAGHRFVDVTDRAGASIARFTLDPATPRPGDRRAAATLPPELAEAVRGLTIGARPVLMLRALR